MNDAEIVEALIANYKCNTMHDGNWFMVRLDEGMIEELDKRIAAQNEKEEASSLISYDTHVQDDGTFTLVPVFDTK